MQWLHSIRVVSVSHAALRVSGKGMQPGLLTAANQSHVPYRVVLCSVIKARGKKEVGGTFGGTVFVFPSCRYTW